jgi:hypothetical protein
MVRNGLSMDRNQRLAAMRVFHEALTLLGSIDLDVELADIGAAAAGCALCSICDRHGRFRTSFYRELGEQHT